MDRGWELVRMNTSHEVLFYLSFLIYAYCLLYVCWHLWQPLKWFIIKKLNRRLLSYAGIWRGLLGNMVRRLALYEIRYHSNNYRRAVSDQGKYDRGVG